MFTYDANGNRATKTTAYGTITYSYDAENRLVKTCGSGGIGVDFLLGKNGFKLGYSLGYGNGINIIWEDVE